MKRFNKKQVVIIMGPPGSGKGTQAHLLERKFDFFHLETSEIIEKKLRNIKKGDFVKIGKKKYFLFEEKKKREKGELMSPPLVTFWVKEKIKELFKEGKSIVTSGSPRTLYEGEKLLPLLKKLYGKENIKVIFIKLSLKESIWRNSHRRTCELLRHPILYTKETKNLKHCPIDGSKLLRRKDDTPETIKIRWREYEERTLPLLGLFKKEKIKIKKVNGEQTVVKLHQDILKALKLK